MGMSVPGELPSRITGQDLSTGMTIPPGPSPRWTPIRHALLYGVLGGALIVVLQLIEYRYLVRTRSFEIYGGLIALVFASLGIWLWGDDHRPSGTGRGEGELRVPATGQLPADPARREALGMTRRELEILG